MNDKGVAMAKSARSPFGGATVLLNGGMRDELRLAWRLFRDDRVTGLKFVVPAIMALYVVSPVDPIPDFLLGVGQVDDFGVVIAALLLLVRILPWLAPAHVVEEHIREMSGASAERASRSTPADRVIDADFSVRGK
jgi:uncharacterized membrane protein YkvA (DUF1232 family)